jgi:hypothetical protein
MNHDEDFDIKLLVRIIILAVLSVAAFCLCLTARAQEPNLTGADFIADAQFVRWVAYAEHRSPDRGLNAVTMIEAAARQAGVKNYGKMVSVAWHEGRFKTDALSKTGYYHGMFQIGKAHMQHMKELDLDYYCEADRLHYGMLLYKWHGLEPWSTRKLARRDYNQVMRNCK